MRTLQDMEIYPFAKKCVDSLHAAGYLAIVITNQSGIARGYFSEDELLKMNDSLRREIDVDDVYYCPHYPDGIIEKYSILLKLENIRVFTFYTNGMSILVNRANR